MARQRELNLRSACDESKCVSKGRSNLHNGSFTCYGDGTFSSMMCADGFLPVVVEDEPPASDEEGGDMSLSYFTCCPPNHASPEETTAVDANRHCSDPITAAVPTDFEAEWVDIDICDDQESRKFPRRMKQSGADPTAADSFLCCDSIILATKDDNNENNAITGQQEHYLDDLECVPYHNQFYEPAMVQNRIGKLDVIYCNVPEGDFLFARPSNDVAVAPSNDGLYYQCCKTGPALPPFVQDSAFKTTVYPIIVLSYITAIISAVVFLGLLAPLLMQLVPRIRPKSANSSSVIRSIRKSILGFRFTSTSSTESTTVGKPVGRPVDRPVDRSTGSRLRGGRSQRNIGQPNYSAYNLYLVYLALLDFVYAAYHIWLCGSYINQSFDPSKYATVAVSMWDVPMDSLSRDDPISLPYVTANAWINAVIAYEVLVLLQTSYNARKIKQPSLIRVNLQAGGIYFVTAILGCILYYASQPAWVARNNGEFEALKKFKFTMSMITVFVLIGIPFMIVLHVLKLIWCRGYIPPLKGSSLRHRAMRELAFYFFRIVAIFFGVWIPALLIYVYGETSNQKWAVLLTQFVMSIQPIVTTCVILTKSDAKKYILDLVTLSYIFGDCCTNDDDALPEEVNENTGARDNAKTSLSRSGVRSGLGEGISGAGTDADRPPEYNDDDFESAESLVYSMLGFRLADGQTEADEFGEPSASANVDAVVFDNASDIESDDGKDDADEC